jgi:hypothetical protein
LRDGGGIGLLTHAIGPIKTSPNASKLNDVIRR